MGDWDDERGRRTSVLGRVDWSCWLAVVGLLFVTVISFVVKFPAMGIVAIVIAILLVAFDSFVNRPGGIRGTRRAAAVQEEDWSEVRESPRGDARPPSARQHPQAPRQTRQPNYGRSQQQAQPRRGQPPRPNGQPARQPQQPRPNQAQPQRAQPTRAQPNRAQPNRAQPHQAQPGRPSQPPPTRANPQQPYRPQQPPSPGREPDYRARA